MIRIFCLAFLFFFLPGCYLYPTPAQTAIEQQVTQLQKTVSACDAAPVLMTDLSQTADTRLYQLPEGTLCPVGWPL